MTGLMKVFVPVLGEAWSGQLISANIPFYAFNVRVVPLVEVIVGLLLILGLFSRVGGLIIINMMLVATYVHLVVDNPALFPLQPKEPVIPLIAIVVAAYVLWRGGGAWCGPCRMIAPVLEQVAREYAGKLVVAKVNTDENPEWAMKYGVQGIPTLLFISCGEVIDRLVGAGPAPFLKEKIESFLSSQDAVRIM